MGVIKCKIIGNQVCTEENLTKEHHYLISVWKIPVKNYN